MNADLTMETTTVFVRYVVKLEPTGPAVKARSMWVRLRRMGAIRNCAPSSFFMRKQELSGLKPGKMGVWEELTLGQGQVTYLSQGKP